MPTTDPTPPPFVPFAIVGFPCAGMDWCAALLAHHPNIAVVAATDPLGPIGGLGWRENAQLPPGSDLPDRMRAAHTAKPLATHVGVVAVEGTLRNLPGDRIVVVRDGRDVLVHWTLRQLRERGAVLQRFLADPPNEAMVELARRFAADPEDVLVHHPWLLLRDYDWVRYGTQLWAEATTGHFEALAWSYDHPGEPGRDPFTLRFEAARKAPRTAFDELVRWLGLDPALAAPFEREDPVPDAPHDAWASGIWPRWFTRRTSDRFKMDGRGGLDNLAGHTVDDDWYGTCKPGPS